ncbi:hypothetical protein HD806DRAFT_526054 [Xylariaceae sp. AK1471]|nr:hypothetical protein HD806DRAFT_526054 [Xylariaceae sp. AK1471]
MCYQVVEIYTACRCMYYQHAVDRCATYGRPGHEVQKRTIPVGYTCSLHTRGYNSDSAGIQPESKRESNEKPRGQKIRPNRKSNEKPTGRRIRPNRKSNEKPTGQNLHEPVIATPSPELDEEGKRLVALPKRAFGVVDADSGLRSEAPTAIDETGKHSAEKTRTGNQDLDSTLNLDGQFVDWTKILNNNKTIPEYSNSDDSGSVDTRSVVSQVSTATTVDEDALGALFRGLLVYKGLHNLWPQILDGQTNRGNAKRIIERFLRRFADDLECLATKVKKESNDQKVDEHEIAVSSSKFVRKHHASIASRIYEAHDVRPETLDVGIDNEEPTSLVKDDKADTDADTFMFSIAEEFIFGTEPITYLEANVSAFVRQREQNHFSPFTTHLRMYTSVAAQFFRQKPVPDGKRRLNWTCICGWRVSDDYDAISPRSITDFEFHLKRYNMSTQSLELSSNVGANNTVALHSWREFITATARSFRELLSTPKSFSLPRHRQDRSNSSTQLGSCTRSAAAAQADHNFVLLCVPYLRWGLRLHNSEVCRINSDQQFFRLLQQTYFGLRSNTSFGIFRVFRKVRALQFVKFEVYRNKLVDVRHCPSLPDVTNTVTNEYTYEPMPPDVIPPIGPNMLMHLFENPDHADVTLFMYRRFPKKLRAQLEACPLKGSSVGWGIEFVEGVNWWAVFVTGCLGFLVCLIVAISWSVAKGDVQGGFGIASFLLTFLIFCGGIMHYMI